MKLVWMICASVVVAGAAMAQICAAPTATTSTVSVVTVAPIVAPMVAPCPVGAAQYPTPCAAIEGESLSGEPQVLVLGSEEQYALDNLEVSNLNWRNVAINQPSIFTPGNPLSFTQVNPVVVRQGNPNFPYYAISNTVRVAGTEEQSETAPLPSGLSPEANAMLTNVANRYRGITTEQAMALGYQPMGACIENVGVVYVNQSLIDNRFDPMMPEALAFDSDGDVVAVHYILLSDVPFSAFGQMMQPSPLVQGALQLPVWLFEENENGMFVLRDDDKICSSD